MSLRLPVILFQLETRLQIINIRRQLNKKTIENIKNTPDKIAFVNYRYSSGL